MLWQFAPFGRFGPFSQALAYLEQFGLLDAIIPFVLIFTLLYAVIRRANIFSQHNIQIIVALSISLVTVIPHVLGLYPGPSADPIVIINNSLPQIALVVVACVIALILLSALGTQLPTAITKHAPWIALIIIALVFTSALSPQNTNFLSVLHDPFLQTLLIVITVFGLVIYIVTAPGTPGPRPRPPPPS